jgi:4-amino-4-deoxy-L-arabinose transferase-like glycosyltransferase
MPPSEEQPRPDPPAAGGRRAARRGERRMLFLVFAVALAVRLAYAWQIRGLPTQHQLVMDAQRYDELARQILGGGWRPREAFYQAPLYPYLLAAAYAVSGRSVVAVRLLQCLVGALTAVLAALAASRLGGSSGSDGDGGDGGARRRLALAGVAGFLAALYAPAVFYAPLLLKTVPLLFLESAALVALLPASGRAPSAARCLAAGCLLGGAALLQETLLVLVPAAAVYVLAATGTSRRWRPAAALALVAGGGLSLAPAALFNLAASGELLLTSSQGGMNFYIGNATGANGTYRPLSSGSQTPERQKEDAQRLAAALAARRSGRPVAPASLTPAAVSHIFWREAAHQVAADPAAWLRLLLRKTRLFWNAYEIPDAEGFRVYRRASSVLRFDPVVFGLLAPLAAVGLAALAKAGGTPAGPAARRGALLLALLTLAAAAAVTLFFIFGRYRLAVVPFLVPLAAAGILELIEMTTRGGGGGRRAALRPAVDLVLLAGAGLAVNLPCWSPAEIRQQDAVIEYNLGTAAIRWAESSYAAAPHGAGGRMDARRLGAALGLAARAAGYFDAAARDGGGFFAADLEWATARARHGSYLANSGQPGAALADFRAARQRLLASLAAAGAGSDPELDRAARALLASLDLDGAATLTNIGLGLIQAGQLDRAEDVLVRARSLGPNLPGPEGTLALCWFERGLAARRAGADREARDLLGGSSLAYRRAARLAAAAGRGDLEALYRRGLAAAQAQLRAQPAKQPAAQAQ